MSTHQLTIRGVPDEVREQLRKLSRERNQSVNATVVEILSDAFDVNRRRQRLSRYATWTDEDLERFEASLQAQRVIDDEIWR
jgi:plasmid stability protein